MQLYSRSRCSRSEPGRSPRVPLPLAPSPYWERGNDRRSLHMAKRETVLITGASGGIGAELARVFAENGYDLVLAARSLRPLEQLAQELRDRRGVTARVVRADLSEPGAATRLWCEAGGAEGKVDVLVNNAGVGLYGPLADQDPEAVTRMLQLNVVALSDLTRLALPGMLQRRAGGILNVASIVGYQPGGPRMAAYYASKAFVLSYSKELARELAGTGVTVTALCPPALRTAFEERSGAAGTRLYRLLGRDDLRAVAAAGYRGFTRKRPVVIPGLLTKILALAGELPPRRLALEVNRWLLAK